jgi:hypothetical protein
VREGQLGCGRREKLGVHFIDDGRERERELETVGRFKAPLMAFINGGNGSIELQ